MSIKCQNIMIKIQIYPMYDDIKHKNPHILEDGTNKCLGPLLDKCFEGIMIAPNDYFHYWLIGLTSYLQITCFLQKKKKHATPKESVWSKNRK